MISYLTMCLLWNLCCLPLCFFYKLEVLFFPLIPAWYSLFFLLPMNACCIFRFWKIITTDLRLVPCCKLWITLLLYLVLDFFGNGYEMLPFLIQTLNVDFSLISQKRPLFNCFCARYRYLTHYVTEP